MSNKKYDFNELAPEGTIYVCAACGKTSPTRSGFDHKGKRVATSRWDSSCFLHGVLCYIDPDIDPETGKPRWMAVTNSEFEGGVRRKDG